MSTTKALSYLSNLPNHLTNYDFTYIPWYSLLAWVQEEKKTHNIQKEEENESIINFETFTIEKNFIKFTIYHTKFLYRFSTKS
jgi:hypothetical protein